MKSPSQNPDTMTLEVTQKLILFKFTIVIDYSGHEILLLISFLVRK